MVEVVEDLLRRALKQAVSESARETVTWGVDWERLLLPDRNEPSQSFVIPDGSPTPETSA